MFEPHESELGQSVYMTVLYDELQLSKGQYSRFVKQEILSNPYATEGKDYSTILSNETRRGRFRTDYEIHLDFAIKLCMVAKSPVAEKIKTHITKLLKDTREGLNVSHEQVYTIIRMIKVFAVYEYRKLARDKHANKFVERILYAHPELGKNKEKLYTKFQIWRNEVLHLGKDELAQRVKEYCLIERKQIPSKFTQDQVLTMFGEYEQIKNAIWDLLSSQNKSEELINNICSLAHGLAKEIQPFMERLNQSNLFFEKIDMGEVQKVLNP